jgi:enoyl-CoA hydratase/carnithine racemase
MREGAILHLKLNEGHRRNPLSRRMIAQLRDGIAQASAESAVRVVVISAVGPAFSAGHDLAEITGARQHQDRGRAFFETLMAECAALMLALRACPRPVIAAVEGVATAAGCQLVASCDLAIAGEDARFATPGVHIGLFCSTPMVALSRAVGAKPAMEMLLTGEAITAEEAMRIGLINRYVPAGQALAEAMRLATQISGKPPATLRFGKEAFYAQAERPAAEAYDYASHVMVENMLHQEAIEGIGAFLDRRRS